MVTHVAIICDDPSLQPYMPQLLLADGKTVLQRDMAAVRRVLPPNIVVLRSETHWNSTEVLAWHIDALGKILRRRAPTRVPILLLDAHRMHLRPEIGRACRRHGIYLALVPARLTWLLAPLDTHCFALYKRYLGKLYCDEVVASGEDVNVVRWVQLVTQAIRMVLQGKDWGKAFDQDGWGRWQQGVSNFMLRELNLPVPPHLPDSEQDAAELNLLVPRRWKGDLNKYLEPPPPRDARSLHGPLAHAAAKALRARVHPLPRAKPFPGPSRSCGFAIAEAVAPGHSTGEILGGRSPGDTFI